MYASLNELTLNLNPVALTSRATIVGCAANGDEDARALIDTFERIERAAGRSEVISASQREQLFRATSAYTTSAWVRKSISDKLFAAARMYAFLDIGCGFGSRGITMLRKGYVRYYGIDLPPVIDRMKEAVMPKVRANGGSDKIFYCSADATDYDRLRSVIQTDDPLFIVTEGLMMYLTESEMLTVAENIRRLLAEFGGMWVTNDSEEENIIRSILRQTFGSDASARNSFFSEEWRKIFFDNSFVKLKDTEQKQFLEGLGFNMRRTYIGGYLERMDIPDNIRSAYEKSHFLTLTTRRGTDVSAQSGSAEGFRLVTKIIDDRINIRVVGRLDSINAPKLISEFERCDGNSGRHPVVLDMADCPYISSAGIRSVMILYKKTSGIKDGFTMKNIMPEVLEILDTTDLTRLL